MLAVARWFRNAVSARIIVPNSSVTQPTMLSFRKPWLVERLPATGYSRKEQEHQSSSLPFALLNNSQRPAASYRRMSYV